MSPQIAFYSTIILFAQFSCHAPFLCPALCEVHSSVPVPVWASSVALPVWHLFILSPCPFEIICRDLLFRDHIRVLWGNFSHKLSLFWMHQSVVKQFLENTLYTHDEQDHLYLCMIWWYNMMCWCFDICCNICSVSLETLVFRVSYELLSVSCEALVGEPNLRPILCFECFSVALGFLQMFWCFTMYL